MTKPFESLPPYDNYRASGVECYGSVPMHWRTLANRYVLDLNKKLVGKNSNRYTLLSLTLGGIIKRDMENPEGKFPAEFDTYQEVAPGDFVFCLFDVEETPRTIGLSSLHGMITGAYTVFRPRREFDAEYLQYLYLSLDSGKRLKFLYKGLRNTIPKDVFQSFKSLAPPIQEQRLIAQFLSIKTAQIDQAIQTKEHQIDLLKERKQILIQQTVTRGLNPDAPVRESGIEWIGQIPAHWKVVYNRRLFREETRPIQGNELPLSLSQVDGVVPSNEMKERSLSPAHRKNFKLCLPGDLVVNRFKGHLGVFFESAHEGIVTFHYGVFAPQKNVVTKYFEHLFHTGPYKTIYAGASNGMTVGLQNLSNNNFYAIKSLLPSPHEQTEICRHIEKHSAPMDQAITNITRQIKRLIEYKSTLINSAVTGKIKVPGVVEPAERKKQELA
ncbi:restriction endonuclease subunit S [Pseudomonas sp. CMR5c]|uniref:restriction endonuclease subunit S n=1 Tax=Pseudomonas sp. CMR5c TaxID=658630 RepID=UPI000A65BA11|nr:restriction endonuclease subunit S [Pseudomonas sp. CMR5c]AZC16234.1 Type I restriction-modification system, specificity subunit S [Pseudomonas sp. CMR5c]